MKSLFLILPVLLTTELSAKVRKNTPDACFEFDKSQGKIEYFICKDTDVVIPRSIEGISVKKIGEGAFYHSKLDSVILPNGITHIENYAFSDNKLKSIVVPNNVVHIGDHAFSYNQLVYINIPSATNYLGRYSFFENKLRYAIFPNKVMTIKSRAFGSNDLTRVVLPGKSMIDHDAFDESARLVNF